MTPITVTTDQTVQLVAGSAPNDPRKLSEWLARHDFALNTRCGQKGLCRGCRVVIQRGKFLHQSQIVEAKNDQEVDACQCEWLPEEKLEISIPQRSLLQATASAVDEFRLMVTAGREPLFRGRPGSAAVAVDIGTTTVAVIVFDAISGSILARAADFNGQIRLGDDVVTRINLCITVPNMRDELQRAVGMQTVVRLIDLACREAGIAPASLCGMSIAGNTTMLHLLAGVDPTGLGTYPFHPVFLGTRRGTAGEFHLEGGEAGLAADLPVILLPGLAAYVGADISAGIIATGMRYAPQPSLFIDIGTNGEIALLHGDKWLACATAAGPAFEGSGLKHGMRAVTGAISDILLSVTEGKFETQLEAIGGISPSQAHGICGSAYIDFLAQGRRVGLLQENGRFDKTFVQQYPERFEKLENGIAFKLTPSLTISEVDVALLLQAKAAIAAGAETLLQQAGLQAGALATLFVAGGFGMHINLDHAVEIGLLPHVEKNVIQVVGNSSLAGAYMAALDHSALTEMEELAGKMETIELNLDPEFEDRFISGLSLE